MGLIASQRNRMIQICNIILIFGTTMEVFKLFEKMTEDCSRRQTRIKLVLSNKTSIDVRRWFNCFISL